jgi:hypothetical protein
MEASAGELTAPRPCCGPPLCDWLHRHRVVLLVAGKAEVQEGGGALRQEGIEEGPLPRACGQQAVGGHCGPTMP